MKNLILFLLIIISFSSCKKNNCDYIYSDCCYEKRYEFTNKMQPLWDEMNEVNHCNQGCNNLDRMEKINIIQSKMKPIQEYYQNNYPECFQ